MFPVRLPLLGLLVSRLGLLLAMRTCLQEAHSLAVLTRRGGCRCTAAPRRSWPILLALEVCRVKLVGSGACSQSRSRQMSCPWLAAGISGDTGCHKEVADCAIRGELALRRTPRLTGWRELKRSLEATGCCDRTGLTGN